MKNSNQKLEVKVSGKIEIPEEKRKKRTTFNPGWDLFTSEDHDFFAKMDQDGLAIYWIGYVPDKDKMFLVKK